MKKLSPQEEVTKKITLTADDLRELSEGQEMRVAGGKASATQHKALSPTPERN